MLPLCPSLPSPANKSSFRPRCGTEGADPVPPQPGPGQHPLCRAPRFALLPRVLAEMTIKVSQQGNWRHTLAQPILAAAPARRTLERGERRKLWPERCREGQGWGPAPSTATCGTGPPWVPSALAPISPGAATSPQVPMARGCVPLPCANPGVRSKRGTSTSTTATGACALGSLQQAGEPRHGRSKPCAPRPLSAQAPAGNR